MASLDTDAETVAMVDAIERHMKAFLRKHEKEPPIIMHSAFYASPDAPGTFTWSTFVATRTMIDEFGITALDRLRVERMSRH